MKTLWADYDNALLKHMETHAQSEALEENDSHFSNGHIFLKELSSLHMDKNETTPPKHYPSKSAKTKIMT
jgi:hypothetical protein